MKVNVFLHSAYVNAMELWILVVGYFFTPALLMSIGIKRNASSGQCFSKITPDVLVGFKFSNSHIGQLIRGHACVLFLTPLHLLKISHQKP